MLSKPVFTCSKSTLETSELIDLSKAFDCLRHDLLIAKLAAYGFDQPSLCFIFNYLSDRTQRTKVNNTYRSYTDKTEVLY